MSEHGQFFHYELYGRSESKEKSKENSNLYSILGEAFREAEYSTHVNKLDTEMYPPKILFGIEFDKKLSDKEKLEIQKEKLMLLAEKYAVSKNLRKKDGCILAGVVSYPPDTKKEEMTNIQEKYVLPFLKKKWGNNLKCVISHLDEYLWDDEQKIRVPHYQDHFFVIPDSDDEIRLIQLHAGIFAKRKAIADKADEEGKKHSDRAYCEAMRKEQDLFFEEVGEKVGWKRKTVNSIRYNREQKKKWNESQKIQKDEIKKTEEHCNNITTKAIEKVKNIINDANKKLNEANIIKTEAKQIRENAKNEADLQKNIAKSEADEIIKNANDKAIKKYNIINRIIQNIIKLYVSRENRKEVIKFTEIEVKCK